MAKKKLLIFGASGLLGYHCEDVLSREFQTLITYKSNKINKSNAIKFNFDGLPNNFSSILKDFQPDAIINATGLVSVDGCQDNPLEALRLNSCFVDMLVSSLNNAGLKNCHLVQISSAGVYGRSEKEIPWKEKDITSPISVYGHAKLLSEYLALKHIGPVTIIRSDFFGINPYSEKSLLWWILKNAENNIPMSGWENIHFSPISAFRLALIIGEIIKKNVSGIYNIGCLNNCNKYKFVHTVCESLSLKASVNKTELVDDSIRPNYTITDSSRIFKKIDMGKTWEEDLVEYMSNLPPFP